MAEIIVDPIVELQQILRLAGATALSRWTPDRPLAVQADTTIADAVASEIAITLSGYFTVFYRDDAVFTKDTSFSREGTSGMRFIFNPLDAPLNFARGSKKWCISVARYASDGTALYACVYFPAREEMFVGGYNISTTCNGKPMARLTPAGEKLLVGVTYGDEAAARRFRNGGNQTKYRDLRQYSSTAIALLALAQNAIDGYFSTKAYLWDVMTIYPIIEAIGGRGISYLPQAPPTVDTLSALIGGHGLSDIPQVDERQSFALACGNPEFMGHVAPPRHPLAADHQMHFGSTIA